MNMSAGLIGLGQMGRPMASNMVRKGVTLTVFDTQSEAFARVADHGAQIAGTAAELAEARSAPEDLPKKSKTFYFLPVSIAWLI